MKWRTGIYRSRVETAATVEGVAAAAGAFEIAQMMVNVKRTRPSRLLISVGPANRPQRSPQGIYYTGSLTIRLMSRISAASLLLTETNALIESLTRVR